MGFSTKQFGSNNFAWEFWMGNGGQMTQDQGGSSYYYNTIGNGGSGSPIEKGLAYAQSLVNQKITYAQEGGDLRTGDTPEALLKMDCSELVGRYLAKVGFISDGVLAKDTEALLSYANYNPTMLPRVTTPQAGDIFIWRYNGHGHTGIVKSYDPSTGNVATLEAISESANSSHPGVDFHSTIEHTYGIGSSHLSGHDGWVENGGFFRPNCGQ